MGSFSAKLPIMRKLSNNWRMKLKNSTRRASSLRWRRKYWKMSRSSLRICTMRSRSCNLLMKKLSRLISCGTRRLTGPTGNWRSSVQKNLPKRLSPKESFITSQPYQQNSRQPTFLLKNPWNQKPKLWQFVRQKEWPESFPNDLAKTQQASRSSMWMKKKLPTPPTVLMMLS